VLRAEYKMMDMKVPIIFDVLMDITASHIHLVNIKQMLSVSA